MKKFCLIFLMFLAVSCGKTEDKSIYDEYANEDPSDKIGSEGDPCKTKNDCQKDLVCKNDVCTDPMRSDDTGETQEQTDTGEPEPGDSGDPTSDNSDSADDLDSGDTPEPTDTGDTADSDTEISDNDIPESDNDQGTDEEPPTVSPCVPNPCENVLNSTGICTAVDETIFTCGCDNGYFWNGEACKIPLGKICTGQTSCYDNTSGTAITCPDSPSAGFYGQDAQHSDKCIPPRFSSSPDVVEDLNTGLIWEKSPSTETYSWDEAPNHCAALNSSNYGGISDWRVPNPLELLTIVDNDTSYPATNSNFTGMPTEIGSFFWTSKENKNNTIYAYRFSPLSGTCYCSDSLKTDSHQVLCVSGHEMQAAGSSDFTTSPDGKTVTDNRTGLMWQKEYITDQTWYLALKYCEDSTYAGYSDWRLPNKNELASLLDPDKLNGLYSSFPGTPTQLFCSSSTILIDTNYAWGVSFCKGDVSGVLKAVHMYVRCVRNAE